jgi:hypothetical protein
MTPLRLRGCFSESRAGAMPAQPVDHRGFVRPSAVHDMIENAPLAARNNGPVSEHIELAEVPRCDGNLDAELVSNACSELARAAGEAARRAKSDLDLHADP